MLKAYFNGGPIGGQVREVAALSPHYGASRDSGTLYTYWRCCLASVRVGPCTWTKDADIYQYGGGAPVSLGGELEARIQEVMRIEWVLTYDEVRFTECFEDWWKMALARRGEWGWLSEYDREGLRYRGIVLSGPRRVGGYSQGKECVALLDTGALRRSL